MTGSLWRPRRTQLVQALLGLSLASVLVLWWLPRMGQTTWGAMFQTLSHVGFGSVLVAGGADPEQALSGTVLFSLYPHVIEVPLGTLALLAWAASKQTAPTHGTWQRRCQPARRRTWRVRAW